MLGKVFRRVQALTGFAEARSVILMYHRIDDPICDPWGLCVTPRVFTEQMEVLAQRRMACPLAEVQGNAGKVAITFDDGYADNLHAAKPVLERFNIPATVFVVTGASGKRAFWWDDLEQMLLHSPELPAAKLSLLIQGATHTHTVNADDLVLSPALAGQFKSWIAWRDDPPTSRHAIFRKLWEALRGVGDAARWRHLEEIRAWAQVPLHTAHFRPMKSDELTTLAAGGLVELGAHTVTHSQLSALSSEDQRSEMVSSKSALSELLGKPVTSFSIPFGGASDYTAETLKHLREAGFERACTTAGHAVRRNSDRYQLPRVHVSNCGGEEFSEWLDRQLRT